MTQAQERFMDVDSRDIEKIDPHNEVLVRDENSEAMLAAYQILVKVFKSMKDLKDDERLELIKFLDEVFLEKKAQSYVNIRMHSIFSAINHLLAVAKGNPPVKEVTNMYYYNSIKHSRSVKEDDY